MSLSLLYELDEDYASLAADSFFTDLHLDEIIDRIVGHLPSYDLAAYYRQMPRRLADIRFRQDIIQDLADPAVTVVIDPFMRDFNLSKHYLLYRDQAENPQQAAKWHLDGAVAYFRAIDRLASGLEAGGARSAGIRRFAVWLAEYTGSSSFKQARQQAYELDAAFTDCRFQLILDVGNRQVTVIPHDGGCDYLADLFADFARFGLCEMRKDAAAFADSRMNALEKQIIAAISQDNRPLYQRLEQFQQDNPVIILPQLLRFERELLFYSSYLAYQRQITAWGLPFTLPSFGDDHQLMIQDGFDLALAQKALSQNAKPDRIICNDLQVGPNELTLLLTGPNQGGKTTFARMLGQIMYLAALGLTVPCRSAHLFPVGGIQTHFVREETAGSQSGRLQDDLMRLRGILAMVRPGSLVILNELFSSATTDDACEMGRRVLDLLRGRNCLCLYVSHIHEIAAQDPQIVTLAAQTTVEDPPRCTYRILRQPVADISSVQHLLNQYRLTRAEIEVRKNAAIIASR